VQVRTVRRAVVVADALVPHRFAAADRRCTSRPAGNWRNVQSQRSGQELRLTGA